MAGENIVFFPKYSTLVTGTYYSDPYEVTGYKTVSMQVGNAAVINSATVNGQLQESSDLLSWTDIGSGVTPTAGNVGAEDLSDTARYVRMRVIVGSANSTAAVWGRAVARES